MTATLPTNDRVRPCLPQPYRRRATLAYTAAALLAVLGLIGATWLIYGGHPTPPRTAQQAIVRFEQHLPATLPAKCNATQIAGHSLDPIGTVHVDTPLWYVVEYEGTPANLTITVTNIGGGWAVTGYSADYGYGYQDCGTP